MVLPSLATPKSEARRRSVETAIQRGYLNRAGHLIDLALVKPVMYRIADDRLEKKEYRTTESLNGDCVATTRFVLVNKVWCTTYIGV